MEIINTIYSAEIADMTPGCDGQAAAKRYADLAESALRERFPGAEIKTEIKHRVTGSGSGVRVYDADGMEDDDAGMVAKNVLERVLDTHSASIFA